jgi:biotin-dependent carboxylase-like uncharacterized protein
MIEILRTGPLATVQDLGRKGLSELGIGRSGAADMPSAKLANRLVGNPEGAAVIEATFGGLAIRFGRTVLVVLAGAPCPARVDGRAVGMCAPFWAHPGDELSIDVPERGLRTYVAVRGGIAIQPVLRARCTDTMSGLGPPALAPATVLPIGDEQLDFPTVDLAPQPRFPDVPTLLVIPGPRADWFADDALDTLWTSAYVVSSDSNRVGMRLTGPVLRHRITEQLASEAMVLGSIQVPPSGQPIVFLADHPVTGGYPVIGVVDNVSVAAQARPGQQVRFSPASRGAVPRRW